MAFFIMLQNSTSYYPLAKHRRPSNLRSSWCYQTAWPHLFRSRSTIFLHHQVRNMLGTLKIIGERLWPIEKASLILKIAPIASLYLKAVDYKIDISDSEVLRNSDINWGSIETRVIHIKKNTNVAPILIKINKHAWLFSISSPIFATNHLNQNM